MARVTLADAAFARRDWASARARYEALLADPSTRGRPWLRYRLGESIAKLARDAEGTTAAIRELRTVWVAAPGSRLARQAEERIVALEKRLPAAERRRLAVRPEQAIRRARGLADAQKNEQAEAAFRSVLDRLPRRSPLRCEAALGLGESVMRQRDRSRAAPLFERAARSCRDRGEEARALFLAGKMRASTGEHGQALEHFAAVERRHPTSSLADDARLQAALSELALGREETFRTRLSALPADYPGGDMRTEALWQIAWQAWRRGEPSQVVDALDSLAAISPREDGWYAAGRAPYWRGRALAKLGRTEEAIASWERTLRDAPLSYYMLLSLARIAETRPELATARWRELVSDGSPLPGLPAEPGGELAASDTFRRALVLLRAGLGELSARELGALGLDGAAATPEGLWLAAYLYDRAGDSPRAHDILRRRLDEFEQSYPVGPNRRKWLVAYPRPFPALVAPLAKNLALPEAIIYAIIREESGFDPAVESWANAVGLTQLMPSTARRFAAPLGLTVTGETLRDPETNLRIGATFMQFLWQRFSASPLLVPAGYNAGEGAVDRWVGGAPGADLDELVESIPYDQTRGYTKRVVESYGRYLALYGTEPPILALGPVGSD